MSWATITEEDLMEAFKIMAVLVSNPMVNRNQMRDHRQGETEKVRAFVARVREAAIDCKFEVQCNKDSYGKMVSYNEEIIRYQRLFGLGNKDTQAKILALDKGLPTLEAVIMKAEAEEQSKMVQDKLINGMKHEDLAEVSAVEVYKGKLGNIKKKCKYCDRTGHGRNPDEQKKTTLCKAYAKTCSGHFANVCTIKKESAKSNAGAVVQEEDNSTDVKDEVSKIGNLDWDKELMHWLKSSQVFGRCEEQVGESQSNEMCF